MRLQKTTLYMVLLILVLTGIVQSIVLSSLNKSVIFRSRGKILSVILFDDCDSLGGWNVISSKTGQQQGDNTLEVDYRDKIQGESSLKMTFAATGPNWGGAFYKSAGQFGPGTHWDFSELPLIRFRFKAEQSLPTNIKLALITGTESDPYAWIVNTYDFLSKVTTIGEWLTIEIDLRFPNNTDELPDLRYAKRLQFECWNIIIESPATFKVDFIERLEGPPVPLQGYIKPSYATIILNRAVTLKAVVIGGEPPYAYEWFVNESRQTGASNNTFNFVGTTLGIYNVACNVTDSAGNNIILNSTVRVLEPLPSSPPSLDVFKSDVRGMFVHLAWGRADWNVIAETCSDYGINMAVVDVETGYLWDYTNGGLKDFSELRTAIDAFHNKGIRVHALLITMYHAPADMRTLTSTGEIDWLDVTKESSRQMLKTVVDSLARDYNLDGIMFDYVRWERREDMPLGNEARNKFIEYTGLTDTVWPDDVVPNGRYHTQFINWRTVPITEIIRDMRNWILTIKPNMTISAAVWQGVPSAGWYWVREIGQHTADWVDEGYLNFVSPMIYTTNVDTARDYTIASLDFFTGGAEGKIPTIAFVSPTYTTPENAAQIIQTIKENGADGWIIWRYGGPGLNAEFTDIRPYLVALYNAGLMKLVWAIQNLNISINQETSEAIISWTTTIPTIGKVEYSNHALFKAENKSYYGLYYKDINYFGGTIQQEDTTPETEHYFVIAITSETEFRFQSININDNNALTSQPFRAW
jgi:hypothetical protein